MIAAGTSLPAVSLARLKACIESCTDTCTHVDLRMCANINTLLWSLLNIGQMIAVSIVNGGPGPQCFSKAVVDYLCSGMIKATIVDVPDAEIQQ